MLRKLFVAVGFIAISCSKEQENLILEENNETYNLLEENITDENSIDVIEEELTAEDLYVSNKTTSLASCNKGVRVKFRIGAADLNYYKVTYRHYDEGIRQIIFNKTKDFSSKVAYIKVQKAQSKNFQYQFNMKIVHNGKTVMNELIKRSSSRNMCGNKYIDSRDDSDFKSATRTYPVTYFYKNDSACLYYGRGVKIRFYNNAHHPKYLRYTDHKGKRKSATINASSSHTVTVKVQMVNGKEVIKYRKKVGLKWRNNENVVSINCLKDYSDGDNSINVRV